MDGLPLSSGVNIPGKPERISDEEKPRIIAKGKNFQKKSRKIYCG